MIFFIATDHNRGTLDNHLASWGAPLQQLFQLIPYRSFLKKAAFQPGVYIFSDIELLTYKERAEATRIYEQLRLKESGSRYRLLNHPNRSLRRYELLRNLYESGTNTFQVYRCEEDLSQVKFPVFLRICDDHGGGRTPWLKDKGELQGAINALKKAGKSLSDWIVVECCDTVDAQGFYHKYSVFRIQDRIVPRHALVDRQWCLKSKFNGEQCHLEEEVAYLAENPHRDFLFKIFQQAHIEYGRIDYSLLNGRIQVWEINTNPRLPHHGNTKEIRRLAVHQNFNEQLAACWIEMNQGFEAGADYPEERLQMRLHVGLQRALKQPIFSAFYWKVKKLLHKTSAFH